MSSRWAAYIQASEPLPEQMWAWPFFGRGLENLGVDGQPVLEPLPVCGPEDLLVRVDALGLCNSDLKMVRMGNDYPLFFERDFQQEPGRLGHEIAVTVIEVGERWRGLYHRGQRLGMQPDVRYKGLRLCLGVNLLGGMSQYVTLGPEAVGGDPIPYIFPAAPEVTYVDLSLLEPWACVDAAYEPVRRLQPQAGGVMWIKGRVGDHRPYTMSRPLDCARLVLTDVPDCLRTWARSLDVEVWERDGGSGYDLSLAATGGAGFDDIVLLDPRRASVVEEAVEVLVPFGNLNLVTAQPLDRPVPVDMGRLHYEHLAFVGCSGPDIAAAYGPGRNRSDLRPGGVALIAGAGGAMGRMNLIRTLEMADAPRAVIVTNRGQGRLEALARDFGPLAKERDIELVAVSPTREPGRLEREIERLTRGRGCDDVVVIVPSADVVAASVPYLAEDGLLVVFAGVRGGHRVPLPLDHIALHRAQFTGTSGSSIADAKRVMEKARTGVLSPSRAIAAIGGLKAISQAMQAMMDAVYPGKIIIFPNLIDLPLMSLGELAMAHPEIYRLLGPGQIWTLDAEKALFEAYL
jgi:threonine dehydrogenase-like Zn-dependent dehydrogenase